MLNKRTNVLLNETDYLTLSRIAKKRETTLSALIRYALKQTFNLAREDNSRAQLLSRIEILTSQADTRDINYRQLIANGRKY